MAEGPHDTEPDDVSPEEGPILSPDELDITDNEHVRQLDEGRFVVSPNADQPMEPSNRQAGSTPEPDPESGPAREPSSREPDPTPARNSPSREPGPAPTDESLSQEAVHDWLRTSFEENPSRYGFDVTASFEGQVSQRRMASNDVVTVFESLMLWYAQQVDNQTPVEEILGILLMEANVPVRYPPESVQQLVKSSGLSPDDSIADLLAAVKDDDGLQL